MSKLKIATTSFLLISLAGIVWTINFVMKDLVRSTQIEYFLSDLTTEHGSKNLMLGSSSIRNLNQNIFLQCGSWLNRGIGNSTVSDLSTYLKFSPLSINPPHILLYAGENDISKGMSTSETVNTYKDLIAYLVKEYPNSNIHIVAIKPSPARRSFWTAFTAVNDKLEDLSKELNSVYFHSHPEGNSGFGNASFVADGIHLADEGYIMFTSGINKACQTN